MSNRKSKVAVMPPPMPSASTASAPVPSSSLLPEPVQELPEPGPTDFESDFADYEDPALPQDQFEAAIAREGQKLDYFEAVKANTPSRMAYRKQLRAAQRFLIDPILPAGALHLIGGPSGIGKTTWMLQLLKDWSEAKRILGQYESHPVPWVYISCDRSTSETDATLKRIGLQDWDCPVYAIEEIADEPSIEVIINRFPKAELYVIEGLQSLLPDGRGNQNRADMIWAMKVRKQLLAKGKTIIGTTHSPKKKWGEQFGDGRSSFLGSASLHACFSTMISFDLPKSARESKVPVETDDREITIMGRNFRDIHVNYTRDSSGRFTLMDSAIEAEIAFDTFFSLIPAGKDVTSKELQAKAKQYGMSRASLFRWLQEQLEPERDTQRNIVRPAALWKFKHGTYRKTDPSMTVEQYRKKIADDFWGDKPRSNAKAKTNDETVEPGTD